MKKDSEYKNIAAVLLGDRSRLHGDNEMGDNVDGTSEESVVKALQEKYDAMKDKLLIEVSGVHHLDVDSVTLLYL